MNYVIYSQQLLIYADNLFDKIHSNFLLEYNLRQGKTERDYAGI